MKPEFDTSVFLNCPFDDKYTPLLRSLLFSVRYLGFFPRIALESMDSGQPRISKIVSLVESCRLAIHDLSRMKAQNAGEISRFNMPFELGLDIGCRLYKGGKWNGKKCLILDQERYRYQKAISDISNSDIETHENNPIKLIECVRNWLVAEELGRGPSKSEIWFQFNDFKLFLADTLKKKRFTQKDIKQLPVNEYLKWLDEWMETHP